MRHTYFIYANKLTIIFDGMKSLIRNFEEYLRKISFSFINYSTGQYLFVS